MHLFTLIALAAPMAGDGEPADGPVASPTAPVVLDLAFRPAADGLLSVAADGVLRLHTGEDASVADEVRLHDGAIRDLAVSAAGPRAATAGADGRIRVVDTNTLEALVDIEREALAVGFSSDGRVLRAVTPKGALLALDPSTGELRGAKPCPDSREVTGAWIFGDLIVQAYADG